jgi:Holliday junction resolvase RusA-like endonuclease
MLYKTAQLKQYESSFEKQMLQYKYKTIEGWFYLEMAVYFRDNRQDLDGVFKSVLDQMQDCGLIKNDRYCKCIKAWKYFDKENPRVEFELYPYEEDTTEEED